MSIRPHAFMLGGADEAGMNPFLKIPVCSFRARNPTILGVTCPIQIYLIWPITKSTFHLAKMSDLTARWMAPANFSPWSNGKRMVWILVPLFKLHPTFKPLFSGVVRCYKEPSKQSYHFLVFWTFFNFLSLFNFLPAFVRKRKHGGGLNHKSALFKNHFQIPLPP